MIRWESSARSEAQAWPKRLSARLERMLARVSRPPPPPSPPLGRRLSEPRSGPASGLAALPCGPLGSRPSICAPQPLLALRLLLGVCPDLLSSSDLLSLFLLLGIFPDLFLLFLFLSFPQARSIPFFIYIFFISLNRYLALSTADSASDQPPRPQRVGVLLHRHLGIALPNIPGTRDPT